MRFYRGLCTRHPKRLILFVFSVCIGLVLWNSFTLTTGIAFLRQTSNKGWKTRSIHGVGYSHQVKNIMDEFLKLENTESYSSGSPESTFFEKPANVNSTLNAAQKCLDQPNCTGFSFQSRYNSKPRIFFKPEIKFISSSTVTALYIKKDYVHQIKVDEDWSVCAFPLSNITSQLNKGGCNLPELNPFDESIIKFVNPEEPLVCEGKEFVRFVSGKLSLKENDSVTKAEYSVITRPDNYDDGFNSEDYQTIPLDGKEIHTNSDFVSVRIETENQSDQTDYYASVYPRKEILKRKSTASIPLNIIIVGFDGTSEGNFRRLLPDAYEFLKEDLQAVFFKGYSIVGEATTPALTALLTGRSVEENCAVHEGRTGYDFSGPLDEWPFIFKDMKKKGYVTMFNEDSPIIGAFSLRLNGFGRQPTDHYGRPFWWSVPSIDDSTHETCINAQAQHNMQLGYLKSFLDAYPDHPKFGFTFLGSICHKTLNTLSIASKDIFNFLNMLSNENYLNNTMLVFMGDHGARFEGIRGTLQGKLEERLPFLSIVLPKWFKKKYPNFIRNMVENTKKILSPFDLHATFMDLLQHPKKLSRKRNSYGISLFRKIPKKRRCKDAGIPEHFCPCVVWHRIASDHIHVKIAAHKAVYIINKKLSDNKVTVYCHKLKLKRILSAVQEMPSPKVQTFESIKDGTGLGVGEPIFSEEFVQRECIYQIQFETVPGNGQFEASVKIVDGEFIVYGDISRINRYGSQPQCIFRTHPYMRKFCLCKR